MVLTRETEAGEGKGSNYIGFSLASGQLDRIGSWLCWEILRAAEAVVVVVSCLSLCAETTAVLAVNEFM